MSERARKNRTDVEIARDVLELAKEGVGKTVLMYGGNLSWGLLQRYTLKLVEIGLMSCEKVQRGKVTHEVFTTTEKGRDYLRECERHEQLSRLSTESEARLRGTIRAGKGGDEVEDVG